MKKYPAYPPVIPGDEKPRKPMSEKNRRAMLELLEIMRPYIAIHTKQRIQFWNKICGPCEPTSPPTTSPQP